MCTRLILSTTSGTRDGPLLLLRFLAVSVLATIQVATCASSDEKAELKRFRAVRDPEYQRDMLRGRKLVWKDGKGTWEQDPCIDTVVASKDRSVTGEERGVIGSDRTGQRHEQLARFTTSSFGQDLSV
jgi:hypothetical protein